MPRTVKGKRTSGGKERYNPVQGARLDPEWVEELDIFKAEFERDNPGAQPSMSELIRMVMRLGLNVLKERRLVGKPKA